MYETRISHYTMSTLRLRLDGRIWRCVCVFVSLIILADSLFNDSEKLLVNTKWGFVRGKWSRTVRGRPVANFLGIPYALPPVGDLRFKSPQRWNRTWTTIRDATIDGEKCVQLSKTNETIGNEDCLYLNIFVPHISGDRQRFAKLPVLVYVHGGKFLLGSSDSTLYAPDYLLDQDIILVTLNYRLSILGFFSTANQVSPGNYGIKDVKMALEWIQENIHSFEGNPKSVTLMGHSAGSGIVHILALSKKTEELFHRYILHSLSASSTCSIHYPRKHRQLCLKLAKLVGCLLTKDDDIIASNKTTTENPKREDVELSVYDISYPGYKVKDDEEIMKCMKMIDARKLVIMAQYFSVWRTHPWCNFGPTVEDDSEDAILTKHPLRIIKEGLFRDIPVIIQVVKDEGLIKTIELYTNPDIENELIENFEEYLPSFLDQQEVVSNTSVFASAIQDFYFSGNVTLGLTPNITKVWSDAVVIWPMFQALQYQSEMAKSNIYFSFFAYKGTFTSTFFSDTQHYYGVCHGDELNYFFPLLNNKYRNLLLNSTEKDITMINIMTEMWTSFVKEGIPKAWRIPVWPNYRDHHEFMRFGIDGLPETVVQTDFLSDRMEFWKKVTLRESRESKNDVISEHSEVLLNSKADAINRRLTIQLALLALILFSI